jgi:hypothetical protein
MFGFSPSLETLEQSAAEMATALESATTTLAAAESADTSEGSSSTWKALTSAREQHDRAQRRHADAQRKLSAARDAIAAAELQAKHEEHARLVALLTDPAATVAEELAELVDLDAQLATLIDRFEAKRQQVVAARQRWVILSRELGVAPQHGAFQFAHFDPHGPASRALTAARAARREQEFAAGKGRSDRGAPERWLVGGPESFPQQY